MRKNRVITTVTKLKEGKMNEGKEKRPTQEVRRERRSQKERDQVGVISCFIEGLMEKETAGGKSREPEILAGILIASLISV